MRGILLAAGLLLATTAVQAQPTQLTAAQPQVHEHVTTALLYRPEPEAYLVPLTTHATAPVVCKLPAYPTSLGYYPARRRYQPHIEVIERTYVVVEDSLPEPPARAVPGKPPRGHNR